MVRYHTGQIDFYVVYFQTDCSGGLRSGEFWKYDPTFESWLRGASMIQPRRRHAMAAVDDTIFVLGGFDEDQVLDSVEVWERKANKVSLRTLFTSTLQ